MKKFLKVIAVSLALVSIFCVSAFAATPQERIITAIEAAVPAELFNEYKVSLENLAKQVPVIDGEADTIIDLIEEVTTNVDISEVEHLADLSDGDRSYVLDKLTEACAVVDVTYTVTESNSPDIIGDMVITFYYDGSSIGSLDTHEVKKTGGADYPAANILVIGGAVLALAAVAFVGSKKFALSK